MQSKFVNRLPLNWFEFVDNGLVWVDGAESKGKRVSGRESNALYSTIFWALCRRRLEKWENIY